MQPTTYCGVRIREKEKQYIKFKAKEFIPKGSILIPATLIMIIGILIGTHTDSYKAE